MLVYLPAAISLNPYESGPSYARSTTGMAAIGFPAIFLDVDHDVVWMLVGKFNLYCSFVSQRVSDGAKLSGSS